MRSVRGSINGWRKPESFGVVRIPYMGAEKWIARIYGNECNRKREKRGGAGGPAKVPSVKCGFS